MLSISPVGQIGGVRVRDVRSYRLQEQMHIFLEQCGLCVRRRTFTTAAGIALVGTLSGCLDQLNDGGDGDDGNREDLSGELASPRDLVVENLAEDAHTVDVTVTVEGEEYHSQTYDLGGGEESVEEDFVTEKGYYTVSATLDDGSSEDELEWAVSDGSGNGYVGVTQNGSLLLTGDLN